MMALVVSVVSLHMHGQSWHTGVELAANCAAFSRIRVNLPVSGQVAAGGKFFAAIWTTFTFLVGRKVALGIRGGV